METYASPYPPQWRAELGTLKVLLITPTFGYINRKEKQEKRKEEERRREGRKEILNKT